MVSTAELTATGEIACSLARRAVDLARDERILTLDGAEHLARLAMGRKTTLEVALAELGRASPSPEAVCAHRLLVKAISLVEADLSGDLRP
jgi:hypothetical protein